MDLIANYDCLPDFVSRKGAN